MTRRSDLAIRAIQVLAASPEGKRGEDLAAAIGATRGILPQVMAPLVRARWVSSAYGPHGGYRLRPSTAPLAVLDVIEAVEGPIDLVACVLEPEVACAARAGGTRRPCALHASWTRARTALHDELARSPVLAPARVPGREGRSSMSDSDSAVERNGDGPLSRRALLKGAGGLAAGGAGAVFLAACAPAKAPNWTFAPTKPSASPGAVAQATSPAGVASPQPPEAAASNQPAQAVTVDEISRHPSDMPGSADYGLYAEGRYERLGRRGAGPMVHEVHFTSREVVAEVVPGTTMTYWTFDGTVPGPMLRARVGDTVDFFLKNDAASSMPHNVDFHAVNGPGGGAVRLDTLPGSESELKVKLLNPGIYIYHCAFPDVPMHIAHGMYGLIVVEPEGGLPVVDHEYYILQSEFYTDRGAKLGYAQLKDAGHLPFSPEYANEERPTFVVFNGRPESIAGDRALGVFDEPIKTGETVRLFVGNIGPNLVSSFHVIGEIFDVVYVEGSFDLRNRNVQSTVVSAGGAAGVEFRVDVPGTYLLVDHSIFRTHKGAAGELVVEGDPVPDIFESVKYDDIRG